MKNIIKIIIAIILCSCSSEQSGDSTRTTIFNNSGHSIELQLFRKGEFRSSEVIENNGNKEYFLAGDLGGPLGFVLPPFKTVVDSAQIIYGELASIWHTKADNQVVSKSLLLESSYKGGKVKDGLYEFTYTFTEDDFQEALDFGD